MSRPRDLATRSMRVGYEHTLERAIWLAGTLLGMVAGFLAGWLVHSRHSMPIVINPPALIASPASYCACPITSKTSCSEVARMCYAQKRSTGVAP